MYALAQLVGPTGEVVGVNMKESRLAPHFDFIGDFARHYGIFEGCGKALPFGGQAADEESCGNC